MSIELVWVTLALMGLVTFLTRLSFIVAWSRISVPPLAHEALRYVPAAVLAAIVVPGLLMPEGQIDISLGNGRLLAGLLAALVAWRTRSSLLTIVVGGAALVALRLAGLDG
ncbi:MAG: AzlD domain-containing protein [Chloroflexota bacterium]|nr:MAG: branched-chain amino acid ABC transporter permease [Chloroflexota bacterium]